MEKETTISGIFRTDAGALINKNNDALASYKAKKMQSRKLLELEEKVQNINADVSDIKKMLTQLLERHKDN